MTEDLKKKAQKMLLQSRGWKEIYPGVYVGEEQEITPHQSSEYNIKMQYWDRKFEEIQENSYLIYLENDLPLISEVDSDKNLSKSARSEEQNLEVKLFLEN